MLHLASHQEIEIQQVLISFVEFILNQFKNNLLKLLNIIIRPHKILVKTIGEWNDHILGYTNVIIQWMIEFGYNTFLNVRFKISIFYLTGNNQKIHYHRNILFQKRLHKLLIWSLSQI